MILFPLYALDSFALFLNLQMEHLSHSVSWIFLPNSSEIICVGDGFGVLESP